MSMHHDHDPSSTEEASTPTENVANNRRKSGKMRRKVATRTMSPMPVAAYLAPPTPPPLQPHRDEDLPAAKRPRIQISASSISTLGDGNVDVDAQSITDSDDSLAIVRTVTDIVIEVATILNAESSRAPRHCWKPEDDAKVSEAVTKYGQDWNAVAALLELPGLLYDQCRQRCVNVLAPTHNRKPGQRWTEEEDAELIAAVKKHGNTDWVAISASMSGQTNVQCRQRWVNVLDPNSDRATGKWTVKEDTKLTEAVNKYGQDWGTVSALVPGRIYEQCRQRWVYILEPTRDHKNKGKSWAAEEDAELVEAVKRHGNNWVAVAADMTGRTNRNCRERWVYVLDPALDHKTGLKWKAEEDAELVEAVKRHGNSWVAVAADMSGRSNRQCRQRWTNVSKDSTHKRKPMKRWTEEEDAKLIAAVKKQHGNTDWVVVAAGMSGQTNIQCRQRWVSNLDNTSDRTKGKWTVKEDEKLTEAVNKHGQDWNAVAALISGRMYEQCRQRWVYVLDPTRDHKTKGKSWKAEEDTKLIEAVQRHGNNWVAVAADMAGRSNRQCCHRWTNEIGPLTANKGNGKK